MTGRVVQLVVSCVVLGVGVALLLEAALGSDGYSTLINGLALATGTPFVVVNVLVGVVLVAMAWPGGSGQASARWCSRWSSGSASPVR